MSTEKKALHTFCEAVLLNPMSDPSEIRWANDRLAELQSQKAAEIKQAA